jgi:hypothetical protein
VAKFTIGGKTFDLPDDAVAEIKKSQGKAGKAPGLDEIKAKHPWVGDVVELVQVPSANGFKYAVQTVCQAGRLVRTTSRYTGIDTVQPIRIDHKEAAMRVYDYSGLEECDEPITKATSDLHQSHLCNGCKTKLESFRKKGLAELAKQLMGRKPGE